MGIIGETLRVLEYPKVKVLLARLTVTDPGREAAEALAPLDSAAAVAASLSAVSEMAALLGGHGRPPLEGSRDLRGALRTLRAAGSWLPPAGLLEVLSSLEAAQSCRRYFDDREEAPGLAALAAPLALCRELQQRLRQSIGARGEILDSASFELGELRRDSRRLRDRIKRALEELLGSESLAGVFQDRIITERGGRYVVPVRADHRGRLKGLVHDESASGQTLYVEPVAVLEWNNQLQALLREEKREEERILRQLADEVRRESTALAGNQQILARLDFLAAAARFSRQMGGEAPQIAPRPLIALRQARHPLLLFHPDGTPRDAAAIPVDLLLEAEADTLVVSGPNTGGKTVALKTIGLLVLLVRSGLHIPCAPDSQVYLFDKIFADIGDEQSIEDNLSTFSGHLGRIRSILAGADERSLVLLDEVGTGTDPAEGGALAMAVLDSLRQRGARTVVTTHLNLVKGYAHLQAGVVNAAVEFDRQTLAPTYRLHYGIPGASNAFTIARLLGLPETVLAQAESYLQPGEREGLEVIERLNTLRRDLDRELRETQALRLRAQQERERRKVLLQQLETQKGAILEKASRRGEQLVREAQRKLKEVLATARLAGDAQTQARLGAEINEVQHHLAALRPAPLRQGPVPQKVAVGELLRVCALNTEGEVVRVVGGEVELRVHGKKLRQPLTGLEQFAPRRFARKQGPGAVRSAVQRDGFNPRLLLVGQRVDAALPRLERFLDDALLHGLHELEIVHGAGEGILRRAVREVLAAHREVVAFHAADVAHGGENVTVVELRG